MLEAQAYQTECGLDFEPWIVDGPDYSFRPIGECAVCDEPTEVAYSCSNCEAILCPNCVSGSLDLIEVGVSKANLEKMALCPDCPGACSQYVL
jgi:hypothetical protein